MFEVKHALLNCHSRFSPARAQRLRVLTLLLVVALMTTVCDGAAQAQTIDLPKDWTKSLKLSGNLPAGTVNEAYNAVLSVDGGRSPYFFLVYEGALPPGISLNPGTGTLSGKALAAGTFRFEVIVMELWLHEYGSSAFAIVVGGGSENVTVNVSPTSATLSSNQKQQFTAAVSGTSNTGARWSATAGSVNASGLYTAPAVSAKTNVVVTATSVADSSRSASTAITVEPATSQALQITTSSLPAGQQGASFSAVFNATGGTAPYHWSISAGTPPAGITMNTNGDFAGTPTAVGTSSFTVAATDATNKTATSNFSIAVLAGGNFDGPAELPRVTVSSAMADTPALGSTLSVQAGGNLQAALDNANCGDTIALQAGATFTGTFYFQAKNCDNANWIIVRTSAPDSSLPAEGQRLTPCYAGVASLPGRPQYACSTPRNVLAKLVVPDAGSVVVRFQPGANHYRLLGLELTRSTGTRGAPSLISLAPGGSAEYIVVDRSWLHGTAKDETDQGFSLDGTNYVAIVDSYFSDFHCTAMTGACTDSHAMSGGLGRHQDGPYLIQNNFLEASGEAILFGGGGATVTPTDITISSNHFFKPWQWMKGSPNFQGGDSGHPFIVKNHLELKNAIRVLAEDNLMENVWGGFSQPGYAIVLTPKNQHLATGQDVCPVCQVTDVTVRYTHIAHAGAGICMATSISGNGANGAAALAGTRWSIHDVVMDDISTHYAGSGNLFEVMNNWPTNSLNTVAINHITGFPDPTSHLMFIGNRSSNAPMYGFVFSDNIVTTAEYPVWGTGGGPTSCAYDGTPAFKISKCFDSYTFAGNVLIGTPSAFPPDSWPTGNFFPSDPSSIFVQYNNGNSGNYQLQSSSPYLNQGTDGRSPGADIVGLDAALAGVE
jgi:hypothetical protein